MLFFVGLSQELNNLDVCVNPESSYLLVEWEVKNTWQYLQVMCRVAAVQYVDVLIYSITSGMS